MSAMRHRIALVGNPNVGKSVLFAALTGKYATVSNYPGTTVEVTRGEPHGAARAAFREAIDTPGTNNLVPASEDEAVTRDILLSREDGDVAAHVVDAKNLRRGLLLALELGELDVAEVLVLNMTDEARSRGMVIDATRLSERLGVPVVATVATQGEGVDRLVRALGDARAVRVAVEYPEAIATALAEIEEALPARVRGRRAVAGMLLADDRTLERWASAQLEPDERERVVEVRRRAVARLGTGVFAAMTAARIRVVEQILSGVVLTNDAAEPPATARRRGGVAKAGTAILALLASVPTAIAVDAAARALSAVDSGAPPKADPLDEIGAASLFSAGLETAGGFVLLGLLVALNALLFFRERSTMRAVLKSFGAQATAYVAFWLSHTILWSAGAPNLIPLALFAVIAVGLLAAFVFSPLRAGAAFVRAVSRTSMHPLWGVPFLIAVLLLTYKFVGGFGAKTSVDFLQTSVFGKAVATRTFELRPGAAIAGGASFLPEMNAHGDPKALTEYLTDSVRVLVRAEPDGPLATTLTVRIEKVSGGASEPTAEGSISFYEADNRGSFGDVEAIETGVYRVRYTFAETGAAAAIEVRNWRGFVNRFVYGVVHAIPSKFARDLIAGPYGVVSMALTYAIALILPIIATFFIAFSLLEDSGYLPRLAVMVDRIFRLMGLNGKAVLPMVLGLGCDTMATTTARILETRKERILVTLLLALGVPCSAQLGVILAMLATVPAAAAIWWGATVVLVMVAVGLIASRVIPGRTSDLILELPPLRVPLAGNIVIKTVGRIEWYLKEAVPLFVIATLVLFALDKLDILASITKGLEPIVVSFLGLPPDAGEAFLIGFLRRDFGATKLFDMSHREVLGSIQVVVAMTTITLFIPCVANVLMIWKERGARVAVAMVAFIFPLAFVAGGTLNALMPRGEPAGTIPVAVVMEGARATVRLGPLVDAENNRLSGEKVVVTFSGKDEEVTMNGGFATVVVDARRAGDAVPLGARSVRGSARGAAELRFSAGATTTGTATILGAAR